MPVQSRSSTFAHAASESRRLASSGDASRYAASADSSSASASRATPSSSSPSEPTSASGGMYSEVSAAIDVDRSRDSSGTRSHCSLSVPAACSRITGCCGGYASSKHNFTSDASERE